MIRQTLIAAALLLPTTFMTSTALAADAEAIFAGGCFWCIEKDFEKIKGVKEVKSGYSGGTLANPTYKNHSGHREVVKIFYDDSKVSYDQLLNFFFRTVDPTDGGGQFCDRGFAYSTAVYAMNGKELESAQKAKAEAGRALGKKIATEIAMAGKFTDAEGYHQNYYKKNPIRYNYYRTACGRNKTVKKLWGDMAYKFPGKSS